MPDAVIVATARTPIGRARKGSLVDVRPDDLLAGIVNAVLDKVPQLDPNDVEDIISGAGNHSGEHNQNIARVVAVLLGLDGVPGVSINRYCSSSLQTIRMAAHAIRAGEGDVFVSCGVECVSRYGHGVGTPSTDPRNPRFQPGWERSASRAEEDAEPWAPPDHPPDIYIAMGQTAENVVQLKGITRQEQDGFACLSQNRAAEDSTLDA